MIFTLFINVFTKARLHTFLLNWVYSIWYIMMTSKVYKCCIFLPKGSDLCCALGTSLRVCEIIAMRFSVVCARPTRGWLSHWWMGKERYGVVHGLVHWLLMVVELRHVKNCWLLYFMLNFIHNAAYMLRISYLWDLYESFYPITPKHRVDGVWQFTMPSGNVIMPKWYVVPLPYFSFM